MKKIILIALGVLTFVSVNAQDSTATVRPLPTPPSPAQRVQRTVQQPVQTTTIAQTATIVEEAKPTTLEGQFQTLIDRAGSWQNLKMLDRGKLAVFQRSMVDSLNNVKSKLSAERQRVMTNEQNIKELNDKITELQTALDQTRDQRESVNFFGIFLSKGAYNSLMWGIVLILGGLLAFYIYQYSNGNVITKKSINDLAALEEEYENYKKTAIEREQKVRRQLQDEINKHR